MMDPEKQNIESLSLNMNDGSVAFDYLTSDCSGMRFTADTNYFSRYVLGAASDGTSGYIQFKYVWSQASNFRTVFILFGDIMMSSDGLTVSDIRVKIRDPVNDQE